MRNKNLSMDIFGAKIDKSLYNVSQPSTNNYKREYSFDIHLDSYNPSPTTTEAVFIKGDRNTSILRSTIFKDGSPLNLSEFVVTANVKEGVRATVTIPVTILSEVDGAIEINLPTNIVDEQGSNSFELSLQKGEDVIISQQYSYSVLGALGEGTAGSPTQLTTLQTLILQVEASKDTVDFVTTDGQARIDAVVSNGTDAINTVVVNGEKAMEDLVSELEITQTDIDDIIGMVGGL